jgi:phosphoribosylformylglycinamidine synthase
MLNPNCTMIYFFENSRKHIFAVQSNEAFTAETTSKLNWLFGEASLLPTEILPGSFIGPRATMVTPWSTNAVEITQNMGINGISRIEEFEPATAANAQFDPMLLQRYESLDQTIYTINIVPEPILNISDIAA